MRHVAQLASHPISPTGVTRETKRSPTLPPNELPPQRGACVAATQCYYVPVVSDTE